MSRRTRVALEALVSGVLLAAILHWAGIHRVLHELTGPSFAGSCLRSR